jgi:muramoyltetrapeptide carboxypeptidase LdcA involved in peptidoglycan recycling
MQVIKRDGRVQQFDFSRIEQAVEKAYRAAGIATDETFREVTESLHERIEQEYRERSPEVEELQDLVERALVEHKLYEVSKRYILYREERSRHRETRRQEILKRANLGEISVNKRSGATESFSFDKLVRGHLWGGCIEVLEFLKGTKFWPQASFFDDAILFFETSEEKPPPERVGYMLRNYGVAGILNRAAGLLLGRPKDYTAADVTKLHDLVRRICVEEFRAEQLVIIADVDIGHTDPKWIVPIGGEAEVDPTIPAVRLTETPFYSASGQSPPGSYEA